MARSPRPSNKAALIDGLACINEGMKSLMGLDMVSASDAEKQILAEMVRAFLNFKEAAAAGQFLLPLERKAARKLQELKTPAAKPAPPTTFFKVDVEFGVGGYHNKNMTFQGSFEGVSLELDTAVRSFWKEVEKSNEKHGDLRQYCRQFANGYPVYDEESVSVTILDVAKSGDPLLKTSEAVDYHSKIQLFFRGLAEYSLSKVPERIQQFKEKFPELVA